jgi:hypothetical protein
MRTTYIESEAQARLMGLCAVLRLPPLCCEDGRERRPLIEIEVAPDTWRPIETFAFDDGAVVFLFGKNGTTRSYRFPIEECPSWRMPSRRGPKR